MNRAEKAYRARWFERRLTGGSMAALPIARGAASAAHHSRIPLSELLWALAAIAIWGVVIGACFAYDRARRRRIARARIRSVRVTRYVDLTRKSPGPAADPDGGH
ncbi:MAG TPA: hypothetical protein VMV27_04960 [Candidatus Binataceae bacterium]|nr:hypothetical protein [Candidatus Binataceae bacterium]